MKSLKQRIVRWLKWSEKYTKTDMIYLAKGGFWLNANAIIVSIFSFILSIVFAKYLTKETYGTYQFVLSLSSVLGALTLTGMNTAVIQAVARGYEGIFTKSVKEQIKFSIIPTLIGIIGSFYYIINKNIEISISLAIIALLLPIINAFNTWGAFLSGKKEFRDLFLYNQVTNIVYYSGMTAIIFLFPNATTLIFVNFIINTICNVIIYKLIVRKYKPNKNYEEDSISFGKKFSLSNILPLIALNIDNIAIFHFLGAKELAIYTFASNIPEKFSSLLRPVSTIALPKFSEQNKEDVKKNAPKKALQLFALASIGGLFYFILSPLIFKIFFPEYDDAVVYSQIYTIAIILGTAGNLIFTALSSTRSKNIFKFNTVNPIVNIIIISYFTYAFGIWGAIIGKILSSIFFTLMSKYYLQKSD